MVTKKVFKDEYVLNEEQIGKGGYSVVKLGFKLKDNSKVAVKIAKHWEKAEDVAAFSREFHLLRSLNHANIVRAFDLYEEPERLCMVLEYMEGGELFDRIVERKVYTEANARDAFRALLLAIEHMHSHNIMHRDLKPENLLLMSREDDTSLKVSDFGLSRHCGMISDGPFTSRAGSPDYIAPEVVQGRPLDKPVDMWAAGVILFILVGGYSPFHKRDKNAMFERIVAGQYTFNPQRWGHVSDEAKQLIAGLLEVNEALRLTASAALRHAWIQSQTKALLQRDISCNLPQLRQFNAMRKLKGSVHVVIVANRMCKMTGGSEGRKSVDSSVVEQVQVRKEDSTRV
jgi:serine/threonine protein kinase